MLERQEPIITNYGNIAPVQTVDNTEFNLKKLATKKINQAAIAAAQQNAALDQQVSQMYGENSKGLGFSTNPLEGKAQTNPYDAYAIDQNALDNEATLLKMYQQEAVLKQKEGEFYNNLASEYGAISANPVSFNDVPDDQKDFLQTLAQVESGGKNITTPNKSGYVGIYQFRYRDGDEGSMWAKKLGVTPQQMIQSPELQHKAMSEALKRYDLQLAKSNIPVNNYTRWLRHNQGLGGARAIVSGKLTDTIRRNIRNQGINGKSDYELIQNYHNKFKPRFTGSYSKPKSNKSYSRTASTSSNVVVDPKTNRSFNTQTGLFTDVPKASDEVSSWFDENGNFIA